MGMSTWFSSATLKLSTIPPTLIQDPDSAAGSSRTVRPADKRNMNRLFVFSCSSLHTKESWGDMEILTSTSVQYDSLKYPMIWMLRQLQEHLPPWFCDDHFSPQVMELVPQLLRLQSALHRCQFDAAAVAATWRQKCTWSLEYMYILWMIISAVSTWGKFFCKKCVRTPEHGCFSGVCVKEWFCRIFVNVAVCQLQQQKIKTCVAFCNQIFCPPSRVTDLGGDWRRGRRCQRCRCRRRSQLGRTRSLSSPPTSLNAASRTISSALYQLWDGATWVALLTRHLFLVLSSIVKTLLHKFWRRIMILTWGSDHLTRNTFHFSTVLCLLELCCCCFFFRGGAGGAASHLESAAVHQRNWHWRGPTLAQCRCFLVSVNQHIQHARTSGAVHEYMCANYSSVTLISNSW